MSRTPPGRRRLFCELLEDRVNLATLFVAPDGVDAPGRGSSPGAPLRSLQFAADRALSGDTLLLAEGAYTYDAARDTKSAEVGTTAVVTIVNKRLNIYGGFSRDDGYAASNPAANPTAIDGQGAHRGVIVLGFSTDTGLDLQGVTVRNGLGKEIPARAGLSAFFAFGGGVFIDNSATAARDSTTPFTFRRVTFENNTVRGPDANAAFNFGANAAGGAMSFQYARNVVLDDVVFRGNQAVGGNNGLRGGGALGGAIHANFTNIAGTNVLFEANKATAGSAAGSGKTPDGESADALGGAVALQLSCTATFTASRATNNEAAGGATNNVDPASVGGSGFGGAFFCEKDVRLTIRDGVVSGNRALGAVGGRGGIAGGGGIETDKAELTLDRVKVIDNLARGGGRTAANGRFGAVNGGGLYLFTLTDGADLGRATITNSLIADNRAELAAGADASTGGGGAGLWVQGVTAEVTHSTIANNTFGPNLQDGMGVLVIGDDTSRRTELTMNFNIVAHHTGATLPNTGGVYVRNATLNLNRNLFFDNQNINVFQGGGATVTGAATNLSGNPLFASRGPATFDYSIGAASAAVNQATGSTTAVDIGNKARPEPRDLGAFDLGTAGNLPTPANPFGAASPTGPTPPPFGGVGGDPGRRLLVVGGTDDGKATVYDIQSNGKVVVPPRVIQAFGGFAGPVRTAAGDVNGDGVADYVFGIGPGGGSLVRVIDGATSGDLAAAFSVYEAGFKGGVFLAVADLDRDGKAEVLVSPDEGGGGRIAVLSFRTGGLATVADFFGIDDPDFRGGARVAAGDLNGDGFPELIVGAGFGGGPRVAVFDGSKVLANPGAPPKLIGDFIAFPGEDAVTLRNGVFVSAGDITGDGKAELIFGGGPGGAPRVFVLSGATVLAQGVDAAQSGAVANFFVGGDTSTRGGVRPAVKDVDQDDTRLDLVLGSGQELPSRIRFYLGESIGGAGEPPLFNEIDPFSGPPRAGVFVG